MKNFINWKEVEKIIFDFDGIFTNNKVFLNDQGEEFICCDRADGLGFDMLKAFAKKNNWKVEVIVLTKERNNAALARCKKLNIKCINSIDDKASFLRNFYKENLDNTQHQLNNVVYLGNDLNDMEAIKIAQFSVVPKDAHPMIKKYSQYILEANGGQGFIRLFIENLIQINNMNEINLLEIL